ncbi:MAG: hypothetical protein DRH03_09520 [Deltaproteobacteria bacterium]|nr:MAG: hypothetical protein DRH03_09520 [Deltaproteobacteria bacterium]
MVNSSVLKTTLSGDGSRTLYCDSVSEHYHSTKDGAFSEALYKHVLPAWQYRISGRPAVTVLDICFGLGYNTLVLIWYLRQQGYQGKLQVFSPEQDLVLLKSLVDFPYPDELLALVPIIQELAKNLFYQDARLKIEIVGFEARSWLAGFAGPIDIVFHDPFSPANNPELWTREYFAELKRIGAADLLVTTYSTATAVRMGLFENGFHIYENRPEALVRSATLASLTLLPLDEIDMVLKKQRNPTATSLRDI